MKFLKHAVAVATAFAMTSGPALAADADQARASTPVAQSEQLSGSNDDGGSSGWILYALLAAALAAGLFLVLDEPASP